jgi:hypothetical protein
MAFALSQVGIQKKNIMIAVRTESPMELIVKVELSNERRWNNG